MCHENNENTTHEKFHQSFIEPMENIMEVVISFFPLILRLMMSPTVFTQFANINIASIA